jgi:hypothetical protein
MDDTALNADVFAEWLSRQGHRIVKTASSYWYDAAPHIYQAFPYHWLITPTERELTDLLWRTRGIALRYSTPPAAATGKVSYHAIFSGADYDMARLPKKARHDVQTGLRNCTVERIPLSRMAEDGWRMRHETHVRQGREAAERQSDWRRLCLAADGLTGFEAWAAICRGEMIASLFAFSAGDCCSILHQQSLTDYMKLCANNALIFVFTSEVLKRGPVSQVFYGLHSLDAPASLDAFKFRMRYTPRPVRQRVVFHPLFAPLANRGLYQVLRLLLRWRPDQPALAKAEGVLRFYLEGRRPWGEQNLPGPVRELPAEEATDAA